MIRRAIEFASSDDCRDLLPLLDSLLTSSKMLSFLRSAALEEHVFEEYFRLQQLTCLNKNVRLRLEKLLGELVDPEGSNGKFPFSNDMTSKLIT